jgi:hypothetical protein
MQQAMMREDKRKVHGSNEVLDKQPPLKSIKNVNSEYKFSLLIIFLRSPLSTVKNLHS